jgi:hypothetical protein
MLPFMIDDDDDENGSMEGLKSGYNIYNSMQSVTNGLNDDLVCRRDYNSTYLSLIFFESDHRD